MIDINDYASPPWETSLFKGIPMAVSELYSENNGDHLCGVR